MAEVKNVYEQLEELQATLSEMKMQMTTMDDRIRGNDPSLIEFIKNAKRVWRYNGEALFDKTVGRLRAWGVFNLLLLALQCVIWICAAKTHEDWILVAINSVPCILYGIYIGFITFKRYSYEREYGQFNHWVQRGCRDVNGIYYALKSRLWLKLFKIVWFVIIPIITSAVFLIMAFAYKHYLVLLVLNVVLLISIPIRLKNGGIPYMLYFTDGKNEIAYPAVRDFMKRNGLK